MSLYTPLFPGQHDSNTSIWDTSNYVDLLCDIHLCLSARGEILAPPSRPSSPHFDERVSRLRENVREAFLDAKGEPASGMWTQLSEQLKMGCVRGNAGPATATDDEVATEQDVEWLLPETEQEWFEWEAKREQQKRLKTRPSISMRQDDDSVPPASDQLEYTSSIATRQMAVSEQGVSSVSPSTIFWTKEKVEKWRPTTGLNSASTSDVQRSQSLTLKEEVGGAVVKGKAPALVKGSASLNFPVVKRADGAAYGNKEKVPLAGHSTSNNRVAVGGSTATPIVPNATIDSGNLEAASSNASCKASLTVGAKPKIDDFPETSFLPPFFPSQLETSTPPPRKEPGKPIRADPPPILPIPPSSSTPPPRTPLETLCIWEEPRPASVSSSQAPQLGSPQVHKDPEPFLPGAPIDLPVTPTKELAGPLIQNSKVSPLSDFTEKLAAGVSSPEDVNAPRALLGEMSGVPADSAFHPTDIGKDEMAAATPAQGLQGNGAEKNPLPTKSYFSSHAASPSLSPVSTQNLLLYSPEGPVFSFTQDNNQSFRDAALSPVSTQNLLLYSPESPVFSFTQDNNQSFRPLYNSTQDGPTQPLGPTSSGVFGMGYSFQFDVERHVDRISELLERDVNFDSWLQDVNSLDDGDVRPP